MPPNPAALRGLLTAIITPFDLEGRLALEYMPLLMEWQRNAGADGLVVCGTNGEGTSLTVAERKRALETVMAHRNGFLIMAGTGAQTFEATLELTQHAAEAGADAALVLPPFFFKGVSTEGLACWFRPLLDAAELPVLLYNIPQHTGVPITEALLETLAGHPNLAGIKDSAGEWAQTKRFIEHFPHLRVFPGSDYLAADGYLNGAAGCISGGANAFPELAIAVRDAAASDPSGEKARRAQERFTAMTDIARRYPFVSNNKSVLAHRGLPRLGVRPPLVSLSHSLEEQLIDELCTAGLLPNMTE